MKYELTETLVAQTGVYTKGTVIDGSEITPEQVKDWTNSGFIAPLGDSPKRTATVKAKRKAVQE